MAYDHRLGQHRYLFGACITCGKFGGRWKRVRLAFFWVKCRYQKWRGMRWARRDDRRHNRVPGRVPDDWHNE